MGSTASPPTIGRQEKGREAGGAGGEAGGALADRLASLEQATAAIGEGLTRLAAATEAAARARGSEE